MTPKIALVLRVRVVSIRYSLVVEKVRYERRQLRIRSEHWPENRDQSWQKRGRENHDCRLTACRAFSPLNIWWRFVRVEIDVSGRRQHHISSSMNKDVCKWGVVESLAYSAVTDETE